MRKLKINLRMNLKINEKEKNWRKMRKKKYMTYMKREEVGNTKNEYIENERSWKE